MAKKKDLVIITIHSDEISQEILENVKKQFKKAVKGKRFAIFGVGQNDNVTVNTVRG